MSPNPNCRGPDDPTRLLRTAVDPAELPAPAGGAVDWDRVEGMLLGLAIGDALGNTSESIRPELRRNLFGEIRDYLPNRHAGGRPVGLPSDDTQLAFWTLEQLLEDGRLDPARLAEKFCSRRIFGMGTTVAAFVRRRAAGASWFDARQESAGNGALMRIAPVLLPHLGAPAPSPWRDALLAGAVTHDDPASNASCVGFVGLLWQALHARAPAPPGFWIERFLELSARVEGEEPRYQPRSPAHAGTKTTLSGFVAREVRAALAAGRPALEACEDWYSGAFLLETVPCALFLLERYGNDPEEAIVRAVNDTRDNDTVAAIVGAAAGALHGAGALPRRWREGLLGRTSYDDDGRVFELLDEAKRRWC